ncbi:MAG: ABC transporter ATP-binding protein [Coriobacteriaceae bacterium]|nr:ABC transporter ATP-binding protein [Coriobacteriaceae bacterium]
MKFNMSREKVDSLKEYFIRFVKRQLYYEEFTALESINLTVEQGDIFGIVGLNGSGKSTLLKIISGILKPTSGRAYIHGSISPLIELGSGFDFDLTARENIFLNGAVLGYSKAFMSHGYEEIIEFAELSEFQDVAIKNFSSGMIARLGFSIATITKPDILIVDEILSVGDFRFKEKSEKRIHDLMAGGTTVVMVSHDIGQIEKLCNRAIWLSHGKLMLEGDATVVCAAYEAGAT